MKRISLLLLVVTLLFFMMSCAHNEENDPLLVALNNASTKDQVGFRISYDIDLKGENKIEHAFYSYWFDDPFYVHYIEVLDSEMSQLIIKRDESHYLINETSDQTYYQSSAPETLELNASIDFFELLEEAKLTSSSVYYTYEMEILAERLNESTYMMDAIESYIAIYQLEKNTHNLEEKMIDVIIKVRKKGEIHSITFDVSDYLNHAYQLNEDQVFDDAIITYYYLPSPFTPAFDEETNYLIDDHANSFEYSPIKVSLNDSFSMNIQYIYDIDIVTFEVMERKTMTFSKMASPIQATIYDKDYTPIRSLYNATTVILDPGIYYIVAIGIHELGIIEISISS